jgi:hypothetical protein
MEQDVLHWIYSDSKEPIQNGDLVYIDGLPALIEGVYFPKTTAAKDCYCEDTGGLLVLYDDGILVLLPFGHHHRVTRRCDHRNAHA